MATMKYDMGGAAAVLAATFAIAELGLPVAVTTYAPMAENMLSGNAMRPGDVLTMYDGQTVEVTNTDAEGRLILADALAMAAEGEHDVIVDVATLTGACIVALGEKVAGLFGDDETTAAVIGGGRGQWRDAVAAADPRARAAKPCARRARSPTCCSTTGCGGAPRCSLRRSSSEFVGEQPWAHLDIAGPA